MPSPPRSVPNDVLKEYDGDKTTLWIRLKRMQIRAGDQQQLDRVLVARTREVVDEAVPYVSATWNVSDPLSEEERERHMYLRLRGVNIVMGRGAENAHGQQYAFLFTQMPPFWSL